MNVIFLSNFYPRCRRDYYLSRSKSGLAAAADVHQYAIALGLREVCENFSIINSPAIFSYPFHYKDISIPSEVIKENGLTINNIGSSTLMEYQFISRYKNIYSCLKKEINKVEENIYVLVYATNISLMKAATKIKKEHKNVKLCLIVPDLPEDMQSHEGVITKLLRIFRETYFRSPNYYYTQFDSFVLLTEYMKERIGCCNENYIVFEGVYEESVTKRIPHEEDANIFTILYSGMLYEKFGILNLLYAFHSIPKPNIRLQLCGDGDCVDKVIDYSKKDNRINYLGIISRDEVLRLQSKASLLVNPRLPDDNPFTRYSFPSKTIEYLASGTPTLIYQLEGIPTEYYQYCYSLDKNHTSVNDLISKLLDIFEQPLITRLNMAKRARNFILNEKNQIVVGQKIYDLLKKTI